MVDWRAVGYGLVVFLVFLVIGLASEWGQLLLIAGVPCGFVAGYRAGGLLGGLLYGFLTGCCIALVFFVGSYYLATRVPVTSGVGLSVVVFVLVAVLAAVESTIAGAAGGVVRSIRDPSL